MECYLCGESLTWPLIYYVEVLFSLVEGAGIGHFFFGGSQDVELVSTCQACDKRGKYPICHVIIRLRNMKAAQVEF